jgi:hypothetical protein
MDRKRQSLHAMAVEHSACIVEDVSWRPSKTSYIRRRPWILVPSKSLTLTSLRKNRNMNT